MKRLHVILLLTVLLVAIRADAQWVQTGGPKGGHVNAIAADSSFLYAATWGHIFRMQKGETAWIPISEMAPWEMSATCLINGGGSLVAGTSGAGVFWSSDHGMTWHRWVSGLSGAEGLMCLAVRGNELFAGTNRGAYRSTDGGSNWQAANTGQDNLTVISLLVKDSLLFSGTINGGVFRSTTGGGSWTHTSSGLGGDWVWSLVALDSAVFAATWHGSGIYRSTDNGTTWDSVNHGLPNYDVNALVVLETTLVAGTFGGVSYSNDRGKNWNAAFKDPDKIVTCFHHSPSGLLAGTFDGTFLSTNEGDTWYPFGTGMIGTVVNALLRVGTKLFAGTETGGLCVSDDEGASWTKVPGVGMTVRRLFASGTHMFAATAGGLHRSTDGGNTWTSVFMPLQKGAFTSFAQLPASGGRMDFFAGTDSTGVVISTDDGEHWTSMNSGLADTTVQCLAVVDTSLFAGTRNGVFVSTDRGMTWHSMSSGLTDSTIQCFAVSGTTLLAGTKTGGVCRTTDRGVSWAAVNDSLSSLDVTCLEAEGTRVFAVPARKGSVFLLDSGSGTWIPVETGIIHLQLLALEASDSALFAGTRGAGVWQRPLREMVTAVHDRRSPIPTSFALQQNYPNPFNPATRIRYQVPWISQVSLCVYDLLGREVALLVTERKNPGTYEVHFDGSRLSSGIYFYRMEAEAFVQTKKLVLLK